MGTSLSENTASAPALGCLFVCCRVGRRVQAGSVLGGLCLREGCANTHLARCSRQHHWGSRQLSLCSVNTALSGLLPPHGKAVLTLLSTETRVLRPPNAGLHV